MPSEVAMNLSKQWNRLMWVPARGREIERSEPMRGTMKVGTLLPNVKSPSVGLRSYNPIARSAFIACSRVCSGVPFALIRTQRGGWNICSNFRFTLSR